MADEIGLAFVEAAGEALAIVRRDMRRDVELMAAESRHMIAEMRADMLERDMAREREHRDRLATLRDGRDGRSWTARGAYEPGADYANGDVVWREMSPFLALCDAPGPCEEGNANWQLVVPRASRGQRGKDGERGPRPIGLNALPDFMGQLVLDDGTTSEPFSVRAWFAPQEPDATAEAAP